MSIWFYLLLLGYALFLLYRGRGYWAWVAPVAIWFVLAMVQGRVPLNCLQLWLTLFIMVAILFGFKPLRRQIITRTIRPLLARALPRMGETERIALEAGTVWWDREIFSGNPNWAELFAFQAPPLSSEEKAFLEGPVAELCNMLDDWEISHRGDLPKEAWSFLKEHRFFGMIIPKQYGGLEFSAAAHSAVVTKVSSRNIATAVTVMVPNSLGPAELLLHYGTEEQKDYYLPRLARGEDIPCFALTGPEAGSDAAATQSIGVVCRGKYEGKEVLGMRLNWNKRYITLGPRATVIGLAFRLLDPDHLLGDKTDLGITCALIPAHLPGIDIGKRHDPMGIHFLNGPTWGKDVFVPLDTIIGGAERAGQGWRMLMESLSVGRSISLPSLACGIGQLSARVVSAYGMVREQFDTPIGRFEGIEEPLARISGMLYMINATKKLTLGAIDSGEKPSVLSAICKAYMTETMRRAVNDAMDIRAGAAISRGPRNILASAYSAVPIAITVEGANILTRSMIVYGQGAIRCHPYVQDEIRGVMEGDLARLDRGFFGHINFVLTNSARAFFLGITAGKIGRLPYIPLQDFRARQHLNNYLRQFSRLSSAFALVSDAAMGTLGGKLKRREKISGRLADALAWLYMGSATLWEFVQQDNAKRDLPYLRWCSIYCLYQIQKALKGVLDNLPNRFVATCLRPIVFPLGSGLRQPSDRLGSSVSRSVLERMQARDYLTRDIFLPESSEDGLGRLEAALAKALPALAVETKVRDAVRAGKLDHAPGDLLLKNALESKVITEQEYELVLEADQVRNEVIQVDAFDPESIAAFTTHLKAE